MLPRPDSSGRFFARQSHEPTPPPERNQSLKELVFQNHVRHPEFSGVGERQRNIAHSHLRGDRSSHSLQAQSWLTGR